MPSSRNKEKQRGKQMGPARAKWASYGAHSCFAVAHITVIFLFFSSFNSPLSQPARACTDAAESAVRPVVHKLFSQDETCSVSTECGVGRCFQMREKWFILQPGSRKISYCRARLWKAALKQSKIGLRETKKKIFVILFSLVANGVQMLQCLTQFFKISVFLPHSSDDFNS